MVEEGFVLFLGLGGCCQIGRFCSRGQACMASPGEWGEARMLSSGFNLLCSSRARWVGVHLLPEEAWRALVCVCGWKGVAELASFFTTLCGVIVFFLDFPQFMYCRALGSAMFSLFVWRTIKISLESLHSKAGSILRRVLTAVMRVPSGEDSREQEGAAFFFHESREDAGCFL